MAVPRISGARRAGSLLRTLTAAGVVAALSTPGLAAAAGPGPAPGPDTVKAAPDKLGSADAELLQKAEARGDKNVSVMIATAPGRTEEVSGQLDAVTGAAVGRTYDKLGYVRATLPTGKAGAALAKAEKLGSVRAIDLKTVVKLPDPKPDAGARRAKSAGKGTYPAPGRHTPAANPYQPAHETGAVDFVRKHPTADGRGVTVGILDSGIDLAHPALQKTTTGERKITDWVTATDPIVDGDGTWRPMVTDVSGPSFTYNGRAYTAPAGSYRVSLFRESATLGGEMQGDLNRDGDTTDSWAVLYDAQAGTVRVDLDDDADFGDDAVMKPYGDTHQVAYFGTDDPSTPVAERIPFVVQIREDVAMDPYGGDWIGKKADFVNIGVIEGEHGTHVAGITAANGLFGGRMDGAAPGAKLVSSRACSWNGGCTNIALTEGMIDLVAERGVDVVNMSIGGLPPVNDGNNARALLYTRLIDTYGVQLVISAGNDGPGVNTIGDPGLADKVISVGATISKETWAADYGSIVKTRYAMMPFSSRGPREDGGQTPTVSAPGASVNSIPTWMPGSAVAEAGYSLPPGYAMLQGTSMASPQTAGASALLLSAAKRYHVALSPLTLRTALTSTAHHIRGVQAYAEGAGLIDVEDAWRAVRHGATAHDYTVEAPVDSALAGYLATPGVGTGVYDRESGPAVGRSETYDVTVTRTSGARGPVTHHIGLATDDGTFRLLGPSRVALPLNEPVTVRVQARPKSPGAHSALLRVDDRRTTGIDRQILTTVVTGKTLAEPGYAVRRSGSVQRNATESYFVRVPEGAKTLEVAMSGLRGDSQTRWIAIDPWGLPADDSTTTLCYPHYNPANTCRPDLRSYADPIPGIWEIEVESRRTSPLLDNPYTVQATALGTSFAPEVRTIPEAKAGTPEPVDFTVTNGFAPVDGTLEGGQLGSAKSARPSITEGETRTTTLEIGAGVSRLDVAIGSTSDTGADLDLYVYRDGTLVGQSADGDAEEAVSLADPEAGTYTFEVDGYAVPAGSTEYDYRDVYFTDALGEVTVPATPVKLAHGASAQVSAEVTAASAPPAGREFFGEVRLLNDRGTVTGKGSVVIEKVVP